MAKRKNNTLANLKEFLDNNTVENSTTKEHSFLEQEPIQFVETTKKKSKSKTIASEKETSVEVKVEVIPVEETPVIVVKDMVNAVVDHTTAQPDVEHSSGNYKHPLLQEESNQKSTDNGHLTSSLAELMQQWTKVQQEFYVAGINTWMQQCQNAALQYHNWLSGMLKK